MDTTFVKEKVREAHIASYALLDAFKAIAQEIHVEHIEEAMLIWQEQEAVLQAVEGAYDLVIRAMRKDTEKCETGASSLVSVIP